jgi:hypothetical protein
MRCIECTGARNRTPGRKGQQPATSLFEISAFERATLVSVRMSNTRLEEPSFDPERLEERRVN